MSDPAKAFAEAHERHEQAREGQRWVPVAAAVLAVLAAISGFVSNLRATNALIAKNDAIVAITHASDTFNEYESSRLKYYVYQAAIDTARGGDLSKLRAFTEKQSKKAAPLLAKARTFEEESKLHSERSERLLTQHETIEVATTLFEVAIVLVSITALVGSRLLPIVAGSAALIGIAFFVFGLVR